MKKFLTRFLAVVAGIALIITLVSLSNSNQWFVRAIDLVRETFLYAATILAAVALLTARPWRLLIASLWLIVALIHFIRIWPYVPFAETQLTLGAEDVNAQCFTALALNVKLKNRDFQGVIDQVKRVDPEILLLMETDQNWAEHLMPVLSGYPHTLSDIQPHAFGMIFASRLPVASSKMIENTTRDTPTLYATINLPNRRDFEFIGLHPKPPIPGMDTAKRDANIARAGVKTPDMKSNALVMGDFNDVPWSRTTSNFRKAGDWRDPRIGRGTYPTFPASMTWLGWPLDQIMVKNGMAIVSFEVMPPNGSDHRAIRADLCL